MAGPRARIGTLSQHAANAANLVRGVVPGALNRTQQTQRDKKKPVESDSDSDSESESDTDTSDSGNDSDPDSTKFLATVTGKKAVPAAAAKPTTNGTTTVKAEKTSAPVKAEKTSPPVKKEKASSDSESESSDSESESESDSEDDKKASTAKDAKDKPSVKKNAKLDSDSESDSSSDSESEASDVEMTSPPKAKTAPKEDKQPSESSSEDSDSESESESESDSEKEAPAPKAKAPVKDTKPAAKEAPKPKVTTASKPVAKSQEFINESDSSDSEDENAMAVDKPNKAVGKSQPDFISQGFQLRKADDDLDAAMIAKEFKKLKSEGKQVWYFTTPKSVPIEVIQKHAIPLDKIRSGQPIFSHDGAGYGAQFEEMGQTIKVMIPAKSGNKYETVPLSVDRVLHITRTTHFDQPAVLPASLPPPRPQPKGLKARYTPFGVPNNGPCVIGDASDDDGDVEMTEAAVPATSSADKAAKKKRRLSEQAAATPNKKSKKAKTDASTPAVPSSTAKGLRETPIAPPALPSLNGATPVVGSVSKSKNEDKIKKTTSDSKASKVTPVPPPSVPGATRT
ncbi:DNA-directed RNA polymerase I subunit RPA34.5-domain-containing protein [Cladorrhinum sp. PSN259]|nr:DNA-directed RNA polymerase I subunit RPA34.5-domain-containing protein [Cladorrhinum sp. PSN259]